MNTKLLSLALACVVLAACSTSKKSETPSTPTKNPPPPSMTMSSSSTANSREESVRATATATIQAIDVPSREVTLRNPKGDTVTFVVDQRVQRLAEFQVGDQVKAEYYVAIAAELREPTEEEKASPLVIVDANARAPEGTSPAGGGLRKMRVVATVVGLDRPTHSVLLAGPRGNALSVRARDVAKFDKLKVGDTLIVTYTEALAVALEKIAPRGK